MPSDAQPFLSVAAPRPLQEADVPEEALPDTPLHHAYRGMPPAAWRRLANATRVLLTVLLVIVAVSWLFLDTAQLHKSQSGDGLASQHTRYLLPDGSLVASRGSSLRKEVLIEEAEFGLSHYDSDYSEAQLVERSARKRWIDQLERLTTQTLTAAPRPVDKSIKIVLLSPRTCQLHQKSELETSACYRHILGSCPALSDTECFQDAARSPACSASKVGRDPKLTYHAGLVHSVPFLKELNWTNIHVHRDLFTESGSADSRGDVAERQAAEAALREARLVIADVSSIPLLLSKYPNASFIGVETSYLATFPLETAGIQDELASGRVRGIWRAQSLNILEHHNGPLLGGSSHFAQLPGAAVARGFQKKRTPLLPFGLVARIRPVLSHAFRFRYPLECGGSVEHLRFSGSFLQNFSHWNPPAMSERKVDVAFIGKPFFGETQKGRRPESRVLYKHREDLMMKLRELKAKLTKYSFLIHRQAFKSYADYIKQLQDIKILVIPHDSAEWTELDFEAVLCGCLLVKVNPLAFLAYPDIFQPIKHMFSVPADFSDLKEVLLRALQGMEHSARMAKRATMVMLEFSDPRRYAGDVDRKLEEVVRQLSPAEEFRMIAAKDALAVFGSG